MNINLSDLSASILENLSHVDHVKSADLPNIDLYMDQVTTFMEQQLTSTKRHEADKILTKTMINNYVKSQLMPAPDKKKYTKEHLLLMLFIYYFKNVLSITDIHSLLAPICERYFGKNEGIRLEDIYNEISLLEESETDHIREDILRQYQESQKLFSSDELPSEEQDNLRLFSFLSMLCFDVCIKKSLIEAILDARETGEPANADEG